MELVANGTPVPATVIAQGIHVVIDPIDDLVPDVPVEVRLGNRLTDLGGQPLAPAAFSLIPKRSRAAEGPTPRVLRTRQPGDPGPKESRAGAQANVVALIKPLIGREEVTLQRSVLAAEIGDPLALDGPIGFTIRRGQRLGASGIDVKLGGQIPVGLSTGDLQFELLTDGGGRLYRNPHQPAEQRPENARAPLYVDLSLDLAIFATDPLGNAVLSQTILGVQATGTAIPTDGVLAIEAVAALDLGLLGVTSAPTNLVLELITSTTDEAVADTTPPRLVATYPQEASADLPVDGGIELLFDEPLDLDRLRAGGLRLVTGVDQAVPAAIESHGAAIVIRPLARLAYTTDYRVVLSGVTDVAGNALPETMALRFATPRLVTSDVPMAIIGISPGAPCALTGGTAASPGRCAGGAAMDDLYHPFALEQDQPIEVELSRPLLRTSAVLGAACGAGTVRVEQLSPAGTCMAPVPGTLFVRDRGFAFLPDQPWAPGARYRMTLVPGGDEDCDANELCGTNGVAANFDPLAGGENGDGGGPNLVAEFEGAAPSGRTALVAQAGPYTDINGSGSVDTGEILRDANRVALKIAGTTGDISSATFTSPDCLPGTPETEACMYLSGALPVALGELTTECPLPGGGSAASCIPVYMTPQAMFATAISMNAVVSVFSVPADTKTAVMRIREPVSGPLIGYLVDDGNGRSKLVAALDLYMDAPDMVLLAQIASHDLHSKPLTIGLEGPMSFLPDGRIAISASNTADVPVVVTISGALGVGGTVQMVVPKHEMKLQLLSRPIRGGAR